MLIRKNKQAKGKEIKKGSEFDKKLTEKVESSKDYETFKKKFRPKKLQEKADKQNDKNTGVDFTDEMESQERGRAKRVRREKLSKRD